MQSGAIHDVTVVFPEAVKIVLISKSVTHSYSSLKSILDKLFAKKVYVRIPLVFANPELIEFD
jgi:hypothetical protein